MALINGLKQADEVFCLGFNRGRNGMDMALDTVIKYLQQFPDIRTAMLIPLIELQSALKAMQGAHNNEPYLPWVFDIPKPKGRRRTSDSELIARAMCAAHVSILMEDFAHSKQAAASKVARWLNQAGKNVTERQVQNWRNMASSALSTTADGYAYRYFPTWIRAKLPAKGQEAWLRANLIKGIQTSFEFLYRDDKPKRI